MSKSVHGEAKPFHIIHDLSDVPPVPCDFKLGDRVIFTNDAGLKWEHTIRAFSKQLPERDWGRFVHIFPYTDAWWFPVSPDSLTAIK